MRDLYRDPSSQRPEPVSYATAGETIADVISGIVAMLAIIAFGLNMIGVFG